MGCRDCNSALETAQNALAAETERATRALNFIVVLSGLVDEVDDQLRTTSSKLETRVALSAFATTLRENLDNYLTLEEEANGIQKPQVVGPFSPTREDSVPSAAALSGEEAEPVVDRLQRRGQLPVHVSGHDGMSGPAVQHRNRPKRIAPSPFRRQRRNPTDGR